jgi:hypothetical protein
VIFPDTSVVATIAAWSSAYFRSASCFICRAARRSSRPKRRTTMAAIQNITVISGRLTKMLVGGLSPQPITVSISSRHVAPAAASMGYSGVATHRPSRITTT